MLAPLPRPLRGLLATIALASAASAGAQYRVTINGEVEFNGVGSGPLSMISEGELAELSFLLDEEDFVNSGSFPTRGYVIDQDSWTFQFDLGSIGLQSPFPGTPFFVLRDNDPAVDGFFVADNVNFPTGVPLQFAGAFGPFVNNFSVTYGGAQLPSLDIADAVGTYDFTGLSVFNWTIDDGPVSPFGLVFSDMTIEPVVAGSVTLYGCGVNPAGSLTLLGGSPTLGSTVTLGVDNPLGTQPAGSLPLLALGFAPAPGFPCGVSVPGFGMAGAGASGELLIQLSSLPLIFGTPWAGAGTPTPIDIPIPSTPALSGLSVYAQGLLFDGSPGASLTYGLADAAVIVIE